MLYRWRYSARSAWLHLLIESGVFLSLRFFLDLEDSVWVGDGSMAHVGFFYLNDDDDDDDDDEEEEEEEEEKEEKEKD